MWGVVPRNRGRRLGAACLGLVLLLTGCTYSDREPGLFSRAPTPSSTDTRSPAPTPDSVAAIPVIGEAIWTSTDRFEVSVRIAVHAVRRVLGGTVLDWSATALAGPDAAPGETLFLEFDMNEEFDISLIDADSAKVYRPLISHRSGTCLCTPIALAQQTMVVSSPRLLQVAFPRLPASVRQVEVNISAVPILNRVPVTPAGHVPSAATETDLARPAGEQPPLASTPEFTRSGGQAFVFEVDSILASGNFTSLVWTVRARSPGRGSIGTAHPQIRRSGGPALQARAATAQFAGETTTQCLCPTLGTHAYRLQRTGNRARLVTNFPALPRPASTVDVLFPGLDPLVGVHVASASDGASRAGSPVPADTSTWAYSGNRPQAAWSLSH
jgi:hypothetical protein